jgi:hypothetical protein
LRTVRNPAVAEGFASKFGSRIRQAGLQVDERLRDDDLEKFVRPARWPRDTDPYFRAIKFDQSNDLRWKAISNHFDIWASIVANGQELRDDALSYDGVDTLRYLAHAAEDKRLVAQDVIRAAYGLALDYGFMNWASKFLGALQATKGDLLDFAHHLKRFQQLMPFGIDRETQERWQNQLKECWRSLPDAELLRDSEALVAHEVLLGRSLQILRSASDETSEFIALSYHGLTSEADLRNAVWEDPALAAKGPATVMPQKVAGFLDDLSRTHLGAPLCVSIVQLDSDSLHLLVCGRNREGDLRWFSELTNGNVATSIAGLSERVSKLKQTYREWLEPDASGLAELYVDWGEPFRNLCLKISTIAKEMSVDCRWLMLSVGSELAALPLQDLFRQFWDDDEPILVSMVPSIGWAVLCHEGKSDYPALYRQELSGALDFARKKARLPDLQTLRFKITRSTDATPWLFDETAIIAGHGKIGSAGFPLIEGANGILTAFDWVELSDYRIVVLHSCFGGSVAPGFLGDLGGLPSLTLGKQTKLLCAPVAEVPVEAAIKLHEHHGKADGPREFGLRYLNALKENPAVGLYNLYGLPTERVGKS